MSSHTDTDNTYQPHNKQQLRILNKFRKRLEKEKFINNYASNYYGNMNNRFSIPGIIITGISSVASFLSTSDMMSNSSKTFISIGVGILAAGSTIIHSVSNSFGFQSRRDAFQKSADAYDDLITRIEFEIVNPNEVFNDFCNSLEEQILKIKSDCKYLPPLFIYKMYDEECKKMKAAALTSGLDDNSDTSLDFCLMDGTPNKKHSQIKSPSQTKLIRNVDVFTKQTATQPDTDLLNIDTNEQGELTEKLPTYFSDLNKETKNKQTTVNKLIQHITDNGDIPEIIPAPQLEEVIVLATEQPLDYDNTLHEEEENESTA